ncbi:hypothetical protein DXG01_014455 [Tephrocybe rancida]|nr:hypothetical protein DXG01_014455 [Tephrocybe rancida]
MLAMNAFYEGQIAGDHYVFYFAGHTFQKPTADPEEEDHLDEYMAVLWSSKTPSPNIAPNDGMYRKVVGIADNFINDALVKTLLPENRLITFVITVATESPTGQAHSAVSRVEVIINQYQLFLMPD